MKDELLKMIEQIKAQMVPIEAEMAPLREQLKPFEEKLRTKKKLINALCVEFSESPMYPEAEGTTDAKVITAIRPDQYFGKPMATVARDILERRGINVGAMPLGDLFDAMKVGGFEFSYRNETDAKTAVATTIGKNPAFIKVPNTGYWGLSEWYPGARRNKPEKSADEPKTTVAQSTAAVGTTTAPPASAGPVANSAAPAVAASSAAA